MLDVNLKKERDDVMSLFKKEGISDLGVKYFQVGETIIYTAENKEQHQAVVNKINSQAKHEYLSISDNANYPMDIVVDTIEIADIRERSEKE